MNSKSNKFTRREFIGSTVKGTLGLIGYSLLKPHAAAAKTFLDEKSRVVIIKHSKASVIDSSIGKNPYQVNQNTIQIMVDEGIRRLTGITDIGEAYKSLFPGITANKKISIKVNCIARGGGPYVGSNTTGLSTHPELAFSIANGLTRMQFDGKHFPAENITIWDRADIELINSGYVINRDKPGVKCYGTSEKVINNLSEGYSSEVYQVNGSSQRFSKILTEQSDYLINVPVLKNHSSAGVTLSLKNLYGTINNPDVSVMHDNNSNPSVPILNTLQPIKTKQVLCICDAIYGVVTAGAAGTPQVQPNQLLFSKDTVALDTVGRNLLKSLGTTQYSLNMTKYIDAAANAPYNIGTNDLNNIDLIDTDITQTSINEKLGKIEPEGFKIYQNYPNPFNPSTTISYQLFKPFNISLNIYDIKGSIIRELVNESQNTGYYHIIWDGKTSGGSKASSGVYLAKLQLNNIIKSIEIQLIK